MAKLSAVKPIVATRPLPTGRNRTGGIVTAVGRSFRSGPEAATLSTAGGPLDHAAATGIITPLAGCGIKNVVTIRATRVIMFIVSTGTIGRFTRALLEEESHRRDFGPLGYRFRSADRCKA